MVINNGLHTGGQDIQLYSSLPDTALRRITVPLKSFLKSFALYEHLLAVCIRRVKCCFTVQGGKACPVRFLDCISILPDFSSKRIIANYKILRKIYTLNSQFFSEKMWYNKRLGGIFRRFNLLFRVRIPLTVSPFVPDFSSKNYSKL